MSEHDDISKLLRLKRYEQPPPVYFETFLREFHRRQWAELMRRTPWQNFWDRITSLAPNFQVPQYAYASLILLAATVSALILTQQPEAPALVAATEVPISSAPAINSASNSPDISLGLGKPVTIGDTIPVSVSTLPPHYVLQPRPVSNEQPLSF